MLETPNLAGRVAAELAPALPFLLNQAGRASPLAQALWAPLRPLIDASPAAQQTVAQVAEDPGAPSAEAALGFQLQALIKANPALGRALADIVAAAESAGRSGGVTASGTRSVAIGGNATGAQIATGNANRLESTRFRDITGSQGIGIGHADVDLTGNMLAGAATADPQALVAALAELQTALGQASLGPGERMVAQTAAGNAALEGVQDGRVDAERVARHVERIGATLKSANATIQEGSSLWASIQQVAVTLGPLVGGARIVAAWFGIPLP